MPICSAMSSIKRFNTQPPEGGCKDWECFSPNLYVSTHSRPKAAVKLDEYDRADFWFQHTAARRRLLFGIKGGIHKDWFQHTAARRRLNSQDRDTIYDDSVSTHSRPKAAAPSIDGNPTPFVVSTHSRPKAAASENKRPLLLVCFNTQPPEGG